MALSDRGKRAASGIRRRRKGKKTAKQRKVHRVMHEYKHGNLHSGSKKGPIVEDRKQAIAIALSEARRR